MRLVERHIIRTNHRFYKEIDRLCWQSKNLYNYANYLVRQSFIFEGTYRSYNDIQKAVQGSEPYQAIPAKVSQQILMVLDLNIMKKAVPNAFTSAALSTSGYGIEGVVVHPVRVTPTK